MTEYQLLEELRLADPAPAGAERPEAAWSSAVVLQALERRSGSMQTIDRKTEAPTRSRRRGLFAGAAALVAALLVGTVTWVVLIEDGGSDAAGPVDIARSFIEARDAWDAEATAALLAPDAIIDHLVPGWLDSAADYAEKNRWYAAVEWNWAVGECDQSVSGTPATVVCTYTTDNAWTRALETDPITGRMIIVVANGEIADVDSGFDGRTCPGSFAECFPAWTAFRDWVADNHADDFLTMWSGNSPTYTPESISLFEQHTDEFVASVTGSTTQ